MKPPLEPTGLGWNVIHFPVGGGRHGILESEPSDRPRPASGSSRLSDSHPDHEPAGDGRLIRLVVTRWLSRGAELVVRVAGDVDLATVATLAGAFDHAQREFRAVPGGLGVVADLRAVSFLSAAGMRVLVGARDACLADGLDLRVVAAHAAVVSPLSLAGLDRMLNLQADLPLGLRAADVHPA